MLRLDGHVGHEPPLFTSSVPVNKRCGLGEAASLKRKRITYQVQSVFIDRPRIGTKVGYNYLVLYFEAVKLVPVPVLYLT